MVDDSFLYSSGQSLKGKGLRSMPFHQFDWPDSRKEVTASIVDCDSYRNRRQSVSNKVERKNPSVNKKLKYTNWGSNQKIFKAIVNRDDEQEIFKAVVDLDYDRVRQLIDAGVSVNVKTKEGRSLINLLSMGGETGLVSWLIEKGAKLNPNIPDYPKTLFEQIPAASYFGNLAFNYVRDNDLGELAIATWMGWGELIDYLARQSPPIIELPSSQQVNLIVGAAFQGQVDFLKLMQQQGVDLNQTDKAGRNACHWVLYSPYTVYSKVLPVMELLYKAGVDLNTKDKDGNTPFLYAVNRGYPVVVKWLVAHGADTHVKPGRGLDSLQRMTERSHNKALIEFMKTLN